MAYKVAEDCTYTEMVARYNEEIGRACDLDYADDYIDSVRENLATFRAKYAAMRPRQTVREFEAVNGMALPKCAVLQEAR